MRRLVLLLAVAAAAPRALAWDAGGHEIVSTVAVERLDPKARGAVADLARKMTNPQGQPYDAITLADWMDDIKKNPQMPHHGEFLGWHYIDIPLDARDPIPSFEPGTDDAVHGNAVQALKRAIAVLRGGSDPYVTSKPMALAMVMHLVGDIHQPLHCATKYFLVHGELESDFGGNKERVLNGPPADAKFNLHYFWDEAYRATFDDATGDIGTDPGEAASREQVVALARSADAQPSLLATDIDQWARDGNALARDFVYHDLTTTDNKSECRLSSAYVARARDVAQHQLLLAGLRLAKILNDVLGS
jgi:uncharacterized protein (UPF0147 family)